MYLRRLQKSRTAKLRSAGQLKVAAPHGHCYYGISPITLATQDSGLATRLYFLITGAGEASCGNIFSTTSRACEITFLSTSLEFSVSVPLRTK